jgi:hypothetical protein
VTEHSDYLRYYLVFDQTEIALREGPFRDLLEDKIDEMRRYLIETRRAFQAIDAEHAAVTP